MDPLLLSLAAVAVLSVVSLVGLVTLSLNEERLRNMLFLLISLAAGALLGDAFIHLLPDAFVEAEPLLVSSAIIAGILGFFLLEKFLHWHHNHGDDEFSPEHSKIHPVGGLVLVSDGVHNLIDGIAIGAAFMVSPEAGIATTIAIALHEIPQEIGDFALLIHAGFSRTHALFWNFISALTAFVGVFIVFWIGEIQESFIPLVAAFTAGTFIYIALADLVPELHKTKGGKRSLLQAVVIVLGILAMFGLVLFE